METVSMTKSLPTVGGYGASLYGDAQLFARMTMRGEDKQGQPKLAHVERVALAVRNESGLHGRDLIMAERVAWLHDILEDTDTQIEHLADLFWPEVVYAVVVLTRQPEETYLKYILRIITSRNALARAVKLADLRDNLRDGCPAALAKRYRAALAMFEAAEEDPCSSTKSAN